MRLFLYGVLLLSLLSSCKKFVYHPNEVRPDERNLNNRNIAKINQLSPKTAFKFILIGDTQRFYEELDAFVGHVNGRTDVSFVLLNGDLVDFGLNREYNWIAERLGRLQVPFVTAIGNHDMLANGRAIFREMFGEENFTFNYSGTKFIVVNTNGREVGNDGSTPNLPWLEQEVKDNDEYQNIFVLSHVAPFSGDFDSTLEQGFAKILADEPKVRLSLHGHEHRFIVDQPYGDGVTYVLAGATSGRRYVMVSVDGTDYSFEEMEF